MVNNEKTEAPLEQQVQAEAAETAEAAQGTIEITQEQYDQIKAKIENLQKDNEAYLNMTQRIQADFDNFRKRNASVRAESLEEGKRDAIKAMLPVLDGFDAAFTALDGQDEGVRKGFLLVQKQFLDCLQKLGLEELEALGQQFDPTLHNAIVQEECESAESNSVLEVFQKGYKVGEKIIRYSMVKVAK